MPAAPHPPTKLPCATCLLIRLPARRSRPPPTWLALAYAYRRKSSSHTQPKHPTPLAAPHPGPGGSSGGGGTFVCTPPCQNKGVCLLYNFERSGVRIQENICVCDQDGGTGSGSDCSQPSERRARCKWAAARGLLPALVVPHRTGGWPKGAELAFWWKPWPVKLSASGFHLTTLLFGLSPRQRPARARPPAPIRARPLAGVCSPACVNGGVCMTRTWSNSSTTWQEAYCKCPVGSGTNPDW
jgi:hypothetical protein